MSSSLSSRVERLDRRWIYLIEIAARIALAVTAWAVPVSILAADVPIYFHRAQHVSLHYLPYQNFLWEYPPLTVLALLYIPLTGRNGVGFELAFVATTIALEYASLCLLRNYRKDNFGAITLYWSATALPLSMLVWFRFVYGSIFLATLALIGLERKKSIVAAVVFGFLAKLWPILFAVALFAEHKFKQLALVFALCTLATLVWWWVTPNGIHEFIRFRHGEGFQIESIPGSILLFAGRHPVYTFGALNVSSNGFGWLQRIMDISSVLVPCLIAAWAFRVKQRNDVALVACVVTVLLLSDRLISTQFMMWLLPFVVYLWPCERRLGTIFGAITLLTVVDMWGYHAFLTGNNILQICVIARNALLLLFASEALRIALLSPSTPDQAGSIRSPNPAEH